MTVCVRVAKAGVCCVARPPVPLPKWTACSMQVRPSGALTHPAAPASRQRVSAPCAVTKYAIFLALFLTVTIQSRNDQAIFRTVHIVSETLRGEVVATGFGNGVLDPSLKFDSLGTVADVHAWLTGPLVDLMYTGATFDDGTDTPGMLFGTHYIVGGLRLSQVRVEAQPCDGLPPALVEGNASALCYLDIDDGTESQSSFLGMPFERSASEASFLSLADVSYPAPGIAVVLPNRDTDPTGSTVRSQVQRLVDARFIDRQTRAVFVDINLLNANKVSHVQAATTLYRVRVAARADGWWRSVGTDATAIGVARICRSALEWRAAQALWVARPQQPFRSGTRCTPVRPLHACAGPLHYRAACSRNAGQWRRDAFYRLSRGPVVRVAYDGRLDQSRVRALTGTCMGLRTRRDAVFGTPRLRVRVCLVRGEWRLSRGLTCGGCRHARLSASALPPA